MGRRMLLPPGRRWSSRGRGRVLPARGPRADALLGLRDRRSVRGEWDSPFRFGMLRHLGPFVLPRTHSSRWRWAFRPPRGLRGRREVVGSDGASVGSLLFNPPLVGRCPFPVLAPETARYSKQTMLTALKGATVCRSPARRRRRRHRANARIRSPPAWQSSSGG
jgi:hypothetical protein